MIDEARTKGAKVHFCLTDDICHLKNAELEAKHQSVFLDDIKLAGKKQNINPMWKVLNKEVDLGEPTSFLDHVYLGCTQNQCEISKDIVDNY